MRVRKVVSGVRPADQPVQTIYHDRLAAARARAGTRSDGGAIAKSRRRLEAWIANRVSLRKGKGKETNDL